jgi:hypothetical protein
MGEDINQIYAAIGAEIENVGLDKILEKIFDSDQSKIFGACSRLHLVNSLQKSKKTLDVRNLLDTWALVNTDALQVYLLCTCLDALADKNIGVGARFTNLLSGLPQVLKNSLISSYAIINEPSEDLTIWSGLPNEEKLNRVIDYLYSLRRNSFTHDAKIVPSALYITEISGYVGFIPSGVWGYSVYFCYQRKLHSETTVLRLVIIGTIRRMLKLRLDQQFIDAYWKNLEKGIFG